MRKFRRSITAALLAVILATQSAFVYADDILVSNADASAVVNEINDLAVSDNDAAMIVSDVSGDDQDLIPGDISSNEQEDTEESAVIVEDDEVFPEEEAVVPDVSENDAEDVSDNDVSSNDDETWYKIPEGYVLSEDDMSIKGDMTETLKSLNDSIEGVDYIPDRVFAFASDDAEAEVIADAYSSDIVNFQEGVLVLDIPDTVSVVEAVSVGANTKLGMPVVYPDFYRHALDFDEDYSEEYEEFDSVSGDDYIEDEEFADDNEVYDIVASNVYTDSYLNGNQSMYQWQHDAIGSAYAWKKGYTGSEIKVAVLDTGIISSHADLSVAGYYNYTSDDTYDHNGHGSHCAGIIAGRANGSLGVGVAPNASIYGIKVLGNGGGGSDSGIIAGMNKAIDLGVDVMSMSLGGYTYSSSYKTPLNKAYSKGIVVVIAAGNDGGKNFNYPGSYDHVICVAATDKNNLRADFSNYSSKVDISAPGVDIPSVGISSTSAYVKMSGTSMATPVVAGAVAVILSASDDISSLRGKTGHYRVDAVEKLIKSTAKKCGSGMGKGIVNLPKALGISTDIKAPAKPVIAATYSADKRSATVSITSKSNNTIYYTIDGKTPSFKGGKLVYGTKYTGAFTLYGTSAAKYTVKAIEVNAVGKASKYTSKKLTLKSYVTSVSVTGATSIAPGKYTTYKASVLPTYATTKTVSWSLAGINGTTPVPAGVSIDAKTGKVTVKSSAQIGGQFKVVATAKDGSGKSGSFAVVIKKNYIKTLKFNKKSISFSRKTTDFSESLFGPTYMTVASSDGSSLTGGSFYWSSSNPSVVSVDTYGNIKCLKKGSAKITVKAKDTSGKSASITVKVTQLVTGVTINVPTKLAAGTKTKVTATIDPAGASNKKVKWSVEGIGAKIDSKGYLTLSKSATGTVTVKATALGSENKSIVASKSITVLPAKISGFTLSSKTGYIFRNKGTFNSSIATSFSITINGGDASCYEITNSAPGIVNMTKSQSGSVITVSLSATGTGSGTAKIKITATDGSKKYATYTLSVREPVTAVTVAAKKAGKSNYVVQGKTLGLKATLYSQGKPASTKVTWSMSPLSSSYTGVSVSSTGTVTAKSSAAAKANTYVIRATAKDGSGAYVDYPVTVITPTKSISMYQYYSPYIGLYGKLSSSTTYWIKKGYEGVVYLDYKGNTYNSGTPAPVYVSSSNNAAISAEAYVDAVVVYCNKVGTSTITITTASGKSTKITFKVY